MSQVDFLVHKSDGAIAYVANNWVLICSVWPRVTHQRPVRTISVRRL